MLIFLREKAGASPDCAKAMAELTSSGWSDITISEAAPVSVGALDSVHPHAIASYQDAVNDGFAALVFSDPLDDLTNRMKPTALLRNTFRAIATLCRGLSPPR